MKLWEEIESTQKRIQNAILRTPMVCSDTLSTLTGHEVFPKLENLQKGGSFKIRGAYNKLSQLSTAQEKKGMMLKTPLFFKTFSFLLSRTSLFFTLAAGWLLL